MEDQHNNSADGKNPDLDRTRVSEETSLRGIKFEEGEIVGGRYKIIAMIGEGGNGVVYKVRQIFLERDMALKVLNISKGSGAVLKRFHQEAKTSSAVEHPYLIKVLDFGVLEDETPFLVMELASGNSLAEVFRQRGLINQSELISIFSKVLEGLAYAHDNGIIHRDIKPSNIMFVGSDAEINAVKIIDFGIAKITGEGGEIQSLTRTGEIFGSPLYMSPEQCLGHKVDSRSDIYSLGCVMFEALTGAPPLVGETALLTLMKHTTETAPSLKDGSFGGDFSPELEHIIAKMLKKAPQDRYQNSREVATELLALKNLDNETKQRNRSETDAKQVDKKSQRMLIAIIFTLLVSVGFVTLKLQTPEKAPPEKAPPETATKTEAIPVKDEDRFFIPFSTVHKTIDGKMVRQCHFPQGIGKLNTLEIFSDAAGSKHIYQREMRTDFELPARVKYCIEVDAACTLPNRKMFSGFDDQAIWKIELPDAILDDQLLFDISEMKGLKELVFRNSNFSDRDVAYLNKLPPLSNLNLEGTKVTTDGIIKYKNLIHLGALSLSNLKNISRFFAVLKQNKVLQKIALINCEIDRTNITEFLSFPHLHTLDLAGNSNLTEFDIQRLQPLQKLTSLDLRNTHLPPHSYSTFKKFPNLNEVYLDTTGWKAPDYEKFKSMFVQGFSFNSYKGGLASAPTDSEKEEMKANHDLFETLTRPEKK